MTALNTGGGGSAKMEPAGRTSEAYRLGYASRGGLAGMMDRWPIRSAMTWKGLGKCLQKLENVSVQPASGGSTALGGPAAFY